MPTCPRCTGSSRTSSRFRPRRRSCQREGGHRHRRNSRGDRPPHSAAAKPTDEILRALVFDSVFDTYRGVVTYVRVFSGKIEAGDGVKLMSTDNRLRGEGSRRLHPEDVRADQKLQAGDVGYFIANIKTTAEIKIGDTMTDSRHPARSRCRASRKSIRWCSAGSIRSTPPTSST